MQIIGYGGGGKGGGGSQVSIAPDSLASRSYAQVVDLISEGEIEGLVNGLQSIYLDQTALQNPDGSFNFSGITFSARSGTQNQDYIPGFSDVENEVSVGLEVRQSTAIVRAITNANIDSCRVRVLVPQLINQDTNGNVNGTEVDLTIEVQPSGGSYIQVVSDKIIGKASNQYERSYLFSLPGSAPWNVRVSRTTPDSTTTSLVNRFRWESYTEIIDAKLSYPNSALMALRVDAAQFQSIPTRAYHVKLLRIQIPSNYDPIARTYTGSWDGTFKTAWSNNPAWCFYDLVTNTRYGLGQFVSPSQIDKWALYSIGQYCDQLVPDGFGGTEPRFTCNVYLQNFQQAYQVVQDMASIFRAMVYWGAGIISTVQDAPSDPVALYTNANVVDGAFSYTGSSFKARHTVALVTWNNMADMCKPYVEYVADDAGIKRLGVIETRVTAIGCTSRGQANRVGRWLLYSERLETESVSFKAGLDAAPLRPGDVIKVADSVRAGQRMAGRISSATTTTITIDSPLVDANGNPIDPTGGTMSVVTTDGVVHSSAISGISGQVITLATALPSAPQNSAVWMIELSNVAAQLFRVIQVTEADPGQFDITAIAHNNSKYGYIENGLSLEVRSTTTLTTNIAPPSSVSINQNLYMFQSNVLVQATFSWPAVAGATGYKVGWSLNGTDFTFDTSTGGEYDLMNAAPGTYKVRVWSIGPSQNVGTQYTEATGVLLGKIAPPSDVASMSYTIDQTSGVTLNWPAVPDIDVACYEVRQGASWASSTLVGQFKTTSAFIGVQAAFSQYLVKALDTSGVYSVNAASVTPSSTAAPAPSVSVSLSAGNVILTWGQVVGSLGTDHYEVRYGSTWASASVVGTIKGTIYATKSPSGGNFTWWVAAVDVAGNYGAAGSVTATLSAPGPVQTMHADVIDNNVLLYWSAPVTGSLPVDHYEVRKGSSWAGGIIIGSNASSTFTSVFEQVSGTYSYWVAAVDTAGTYGTPASLSVSVNQPPDYILRANINSTLSGSLSNMVLNSGTLFGPISSTETFEQHFTRNLLTYSEQAASVFNLSSGSIVSDVATCPTGATTADQLNLTSTTSGWDMYRSQSGLTPGVTYTLSMYVQLGTAVNFSLVVNNTLSWNTVGGKVFTSADGLSSSVWTRIAYTFVAPSTGAINIHLGANQEAALAGTPQSAGSVFLWGMQLEPGRSSPSAYIATVASAASWTSPQDQINAGFPLFVEPAVSSGTYTEVYDYGTTLPATTITSTLTYAMLAGAVTVSCQINYSNTSSTGPWTAGPAGATSVLASNFRWVQVVYTFTATTTASIIQVSGLNIKLNVKNRTDSGSGSSTIGGTAITFGYPFIYADTPIVQANGLDSHSKPYTAAVIYTSVPNPTGFSVRIFDSTGTEMSGVGFSWSVRGY